MLLRRILIKHPDTHAVWKQAWEAYVKLRHRGASAVVHATVPLEPCPPPGYNSRAAWSFAHAIKPQGPVGLLLDSLLQHKAIISDDFVIRTWPVMELDLLHHPIQGLRAMVNAIATEANFALLPTEQA